MMMTLDDSINNIIIDAIYIIIITIIQPQGLSALL